jgi:uncharacterized protein involved in exopolysaccharide biosynthesis
MSGASTLDFKRDEETESEISLLDLIHPLGRHKGLIAAVTLLAMAVTAGVVYLIPPSFTAEAVILPPQSDQSSQALMMGSLAGLSGLGGLAGGASGIFRNPGDLYIGVMKSRTIADAIIAKFKLEQVYGSHSPTEVRKKLASHTDISQGKDYLIHIRVDDHDSARAAQLANAYVDELHGQNSRLALTSAGQRRLFFEQQLASEKNELADAEIAMQKMQQGSGLVYPQGQSEALIRAIAQLRAEIVGREVQLQSMRQYATGANPQVQTVESEIAALRGELDKMQRGAPGGVEVPVRKLAETGLDYLRKLRDVKYHETLFEILAKQYEAAKMDEAREAPVIQVLDPAVVPDKKSWPPRALFILGAGGLAALCACGFVLVRAGRAGAAL